MSSLNLRLKTALLATQKTQKRVAKLVRIRESKLSQIVRGHRAPSPTERQRLSAFLNASESDLFEASR